MLTAQGGEPVGLEFRVNTYTTSTQNTAMVASDAVGNFVVAWQSSGHDGSSDGVFAQRFASTGAAQGGEFQVNSFTTSQQRYPSVASDAGGNFVVAWMSFTQDGSGEGAFAQRFSNTGAALGGEFRINSYTTSDQRGPVVASGTAGNFVVAWHSTNQDGSGEGVFAQRYASTGAPLGGEFQVNSYTTNHQSYSRVASDAAGNFVVVWQSGAQDGSGTGVYAQRYANTGAALGGEFQVSSYTTNNQGFPGVASDSAGNFVVAWQSNVQDGSSYGVFAQRYASTGAALGGEFRVNSYTTSDQFSPSVAFDTAGNFVVAWSSNLEDGSSAGVFAQRYDSTGIALHGEFQVNTYTTNSQRYPCVAADSAGNFVVAWQSDTQDASGFGIFAQRFNRILDHRLFADGFESGAPGQWSGVVGN
ncbi:MAG: hypothetical protein ABI689_16185 [Thermoanaerobaculia bacterium]